MESTISTLQWLKTQEVRLIRELADTRAAIHAIESQPSTGLGELHPSETATSDGQQVGRRHGKYFGLKLRDAITDQLQNSPSKRLNLSSLVFNLRQHDADLGRTPSREPVAVKIAISMNPKLFALEGDTVLLRPAPSNSNPE